MKAFVIVIFVLAMLVMVGSLVVTLSGAAVLLRKSKRKAQPDPSDDAPDGYTTAPHPSSGSLLSRITAASRPQSWWSAQDDQLFFQ